MAFGHGGGHAVRVVLQLLDHLRVAFTDAEIIRHPLRVRGALQPKVANLDVLLPSARRVSYGDARLEALLPFFAEACGFFGVPGFGKGQRFQIVRPPTVKRGVVCP